MPGPWSATKRCTRPPPTAPAPTRTTEDGGDHATAFATRLATARSNRTGSASISGRSGGRSTLTRSGSWLTLRSALPITSSTAVGRRWAVRAPVCTRLMSSRLPTRWLSRSVSSSMVERKSIRSASLQPTSDWRRLVTDALMDDSGVRRSCDTARRSAVRSASVSASDCACVACSCSRRAPMATAS